MKSGRGSSGRSVRPPCARRNNPGWPTASEGAQSDFADHLQPRPSERDSNLRSLSQSTGSFAVSKMPFLSMGGPAVRIPLAPAVSQLRNLPLSYGDARDATRTDTPHATVPLRLPGEHTGTARNMNTVTKLAGLGCAAARSGGRASTEVASSSVGVTALPQGRSVIGETPSCGEGAGHSG